MNRLNRWNSGVLLLTTVLLSSCASLDNVVSAPTVSLRNVQVEDIGFDSQTFILSFDVRNPNPFPLPVKSINYGVKLDGHRFASGEAVSSFTIAAGGDGAFAISVDVNLLQIAPELLFIVRDATLRDIPYSLEGRLAIDIPYTKPLKFQSSGLIRLQASAR